MSSIVNFYIMKLLLASLLLVHTINALPEYSRGACLQTINNGRAAYAEKFQIANMNSLMYNKKMEKSILRQLSFVDGCSQPSIISHNNLDIYLNVRDGGDQFIVDLLSATDNTMMACVKSKCNGEDIISIVTDKSDPTPISGVPGTECPSDRLANSNGLCALKNTRGGGGYVRKGLWDILVATVEKGVKDAGEVLEETGKILEGGVKSTGKVVRTTHTVVSRPISRKMNRPNLHGMFHRDDAWDFPIDGKPTELARGLENYEEPHDETITEVEPESARRGKYVRKGFWDILFPPTKIIYYTQTEEKKQ